MLFGKPRKQTGKPSYPQQKEKIFSQPTNTPIPNFQGRQAVLLPPPEAPPTPPIPPGSTLEWPTVTLQEIASAIQTSAPNKAPGPDGLLFLLLQMAQHQSYSMPSAPPPPNMDTVPTAGDRLQELFSRSRTYPTTLLPRHTGLSPF